MKKTLSLITLTFLSLTAQASIQLWDCNDGYNITSDNRVMMLNDKDTGQTLKLRKVDERNFVHKTDSLQVDIRKEKDGGAFVSVFWFEEEDMYSTYCPNVF
ncbi:hypothetical protein [Vibrio comitans]|uniref:Lipoprotein n=1 Tax=Vibrio comitans NBRC 102076 TaxID=1219078 RepID=A0A4Y3IPD0_9VIBR|nr:hypothetical protein [Vibrio comitans]GEA60972.1 hypothetical protein VCO01S_21650 [Vibrio comitans NBRC 102076]